MHEKGFNEFYKRIFESFSVERLLFLKVGNGF